MNFLSLSSRVVVAVLGSAIAIHAQTAGGTGTPAEEVVTLPSFGVSGTQANQYRAVDSASASRIRSSLVDTPASISVLTPEFLRDISPTRLYEATRYVSGITEGRGDAFGDRQIIRGFENLNRTVDNFNSIQTENVDPLFIERVEVLKGPSAIIAPMGAPGGVVSVVSKAPLERKSNMITATLGLIDAQRVDLDMTGPFSEGSPFGYRLLAAYQEGRLASSGTRDRRKLIGGSVSYRLSQNTNLRLRGTYEERWMFVYLPVFISSASVNGADAELQPGFQYGNNRNGTEPWAHRGGKYGSVDFLLTTSFGQHISSRLAGMGQYNLQRDEFMAAATPSLNNRYNPTTGQQTPNQTWALNPATGTYVPTTSPLFDITNIQRQPFLPQGHTGDFAAQYDLAAVYNIANVKSTTVAGIALEHQYSFARQLTGPNLPINLLAPVYGAQPVYTTVQSRSRAQSTTWQYYVNEQLSVFQDRLLLTGGAVRVSAHNVNLNQVSNIRTELDDARNLGLFGVVAKPVRGLSIYGSRSVNAVPTISNNLPLWQEGRQWEFGAKGTVLNDRLSLTAAHFQISQTNVTVPNPAFQTDPTQSQSLISNIKNHGYEFEAIGGITDNLSVVTSLTYLSESDALGRPVRAIARRNAALLVTYRFNEGQLRGFSAYAGVTHIGRRSGEAPAVNFTPLGVVTQPSFFLAPVTLYNIGGRYTWRKLDFELNVENLFNKEYIGIPTSRTNAGLGLPRNIRLITTYHF